MTTHAHRPRRLRWPLLVTALALLSLVCSGCFRSDLDARISKDGTVRGVFILAFSNEILRYAGQDRADVVREVKAASQSLAPGVRVEVVDDGSYVGERISFDAIAIEDFGTTIATLARSVGPLGANVAQDFRLEKTKTRWRFFGTMDLSGDQFAITAADGADPSLPARTFKMSIRLTFPGRVLARDKAAKVKGRSITWTPKLGEAMQMQAVALLA